MSFESFALDPRCLQVLKTQGITTPTPVQAQAIPPALEGRDITAIAQTGTGKTLAFSLPALERIANFEPGRTRVLVLTPTRELAHQIESVVAPFAKALRLRSLCVYGGVGYEPQTKGLRRGADIVIATPGRLIDHLEQGNCRFRDLSILVLDEADRMLDMGFLPAIREIVRELPAKRQTMLFSATFPHEMERLSRGFQQDSVRIEVGPVAKPTEAVDQVIYTVDQTRKIELLSRILKERDVTSALVFLRTQRRTERVARSLHNAGFNAKAIHGGLSQSQRQRALDGFRQGRYSILVATDVAARGIDVQGISHVVNFDIPKTSDDYIHRIGRTARASATGDAITFVSPDEFMALGTIEKALGKNLRREEWDGSVRVLSSFRPGNTPVRRKRGFRPRRRQRAAVAR